MKRFSFEVSVLFRREGEYWVAQCLEYDIAAQARSLSQTKEEFEKAFVDQILVDLATGKEPLQNVPKAPIQYFQEFKGADRLSDRRLLTVPDITPPYVINAAATDLRISA